MVSDFKFSYLIKFVRGKIRGRVSLVENAMRLFYLNRLYIVYIIRLVYISWQVK